MAMGPKTALKVEGHWKRFFNGAPLTLKLQHKSTTAHNACMTILCVAWNLHFHKKIWHIKYRKRKKSQQEL